MDSKKRSSDSIEEVVGQEVDTVTEKTIVEHSKKKLKKDKGKSGASSDGGAAPSPSPASMVSSSVKPMERKKKRKSLDKERHRSASENEGSLPKETRVESKADESQPSTVALSNSGLPEFHISVFKDLALADVSIREVAAGKLVMELLEVQKVYDRLGTKDSVEGELKLEAEKDDGLNNCAPSLRYAVRRLIRGVSSSRECARQGFALGLTMLINTISSIKVDSLLKLIVDLLEVSSSMKGQEAKDCLLGRLFTYGALVRSGRLTQEWNSDKNTPCIKELTSVLISLAANKRYLQEPAVAVILDLVDKLPDEALINHVLETPGLDEWFEGATSIGNPDALLLALKIQERIPVGSAKFKKLLPNPFSPSKLFASDHLSSLVNCFKESTFCQPRVHSLWPVLINHLLPDMVLRAEDGALVSCSLKKHKKNRKCSSSEEETANNIQSFCEVVIEGSLLSSSHDRKHLAFDILFLLLPRLHASFVPIILSYKFVQCLMDILSTKNSWLYKVAQSFIKELSDWIRADDVRRVSAIISLQKHSNGKFDCITRGKTVKDMMAEFETESGCMLFIQSLMNMFVDEGQASEEPSDQSQTTDDNSDIGSVEDKDSVGMMGNSDFLKSWVVESLPSMLKHLKLDLEAKLRVQKEVLKFLAVQGLFSASLGTEVTSFELQEKFRWPKGATSSALCRMCIEQIQSVLANAHKIEGSRSLANGMEQSDLGSYFMWFFSTLRNIPSVSLFRTLSAEDENTIKKLQEMEIRLSREERNCGLSSDANKLHALRYLLIQLLLLVLLRPGEFTEAASEVIICCRKAFAVSDLPDDSGEDELDGDGTPELMDVLVDTLLSLLPQSSAAMRSAIEKVFKYFCCDVTDDGLLRMLRVIKRDLKPARRQDVDIEDNDEGHEDFLSIEEDEEIDEEETGETIESEEQTDDSEALGGIEDSGKELPEDSDDSDGGMDDDAMFRMDTYLAQIFKERKNQAGSETAQYQLVQFKLRVLSLLEIYLHENPDKPQVLMVYSNLAQTFVNPHTFDGSKQLWERIGGILQKLVLKGKDFPKGEAVQLSTLVSLLEKNLKLASKPFKKKKSANHPSIRKQMASWNRHEKIVKLAQKSTFWILKIVDLRHFSDSELQRVFDVLQGTLMGYFSSKKSQINPDFVKDIFRRRPWIGHRLFGFLLEKCGTAKSDFRRVEALDMMSKILQSLVPSKMDGDSRTASKKVLKCHVHKLIHVMEELVTNMPEKQSKRSEVYKFCGTVFRIILKLDLTKSFLKDLAPETQNVFENKLGQRFLNFTAGKTS
ncbi:DNA polymerase V-like isoform X1 [Tripterygium wilfordii]|uniref:DNA polymerase V-like isoform X1 n=1 Tax=Tripterygium wilfordii TaxID=458696 RepID=A0A7J7CH64_TRIWF|nr:rDNA transcriptional regulator pol5 [Tripterygium wilfordii]XP_038682174.1 rDNA transcriptional regulator pol5 [Tripterygium wilfordii]KAF5733384.1 DNA polymerase V-like isoform X1 [Tripterygium wilfordii]